MRQHQGTGRTTDAAANDHRIILQRLSPKFRTRQAFVPPKPAELHKTVFGA
jgi:hypothetical protein